MRCSRSGRQACSWDDGKAAQADGAGDIARGFEGDVAGEGACANRFEEGIDFVGMDMVEVLPAHDHAELTSLAAATFAWQYLSLLDL